jgi:hypothetical protein
MMATQQTQARTLNGDLIEPEDVVRENRQLAPEEEVMAVNGRMVETYAGRMYHATKVVLVRKGDTTPCGSTR